MMWLFFLYMCKTQGLYGYFSVCDLCFSWGNLRTSDLIFNPFFFYVVTSVYAMRLSFYQTVHWHNAE